MSGIVRPTVQKLLDFSDIVCFQETWLAKQEVYCLGHLDKDFHAIGASPTDYSEGLHRGRNEGGVAVLWRSTLDKYVNPIKFDVAWLTGVKISIDDKYFVILNVYMPYECTENEAEYMENLGMISSILDVMETSSVFIVGDWNAIISSHDSVFATHMSNFCEEHDLNNSGKLMLSKDSFTYVSPSWNTTSWLDHCLSSHDCHSAIDSIEILYDLSLGEDHIPISVSTNIKCLPCLDINSKSEFQKMD